MLAGTTQPRNRPPFHQGCGPLYWFSPRICNQRDLSIFFEARLLKAGSVYFSASSQNTCDDVFGPSYRMISTRQPFRVFEIVLAHMTRLQFHTLQPGQEGCQTAGQPHDQFPADERPLAVPESEGPFLFFSQLIVYSRSATGTSLTRRVAEYRADCHRRMPSVTEGCRVPQTMADNLVKDEVNDTHQLIYHPKPLASNSRPTRCVIRIFETVG